MALDIQDEKLDHINASPLAVKIYDARHYKPHVHSHAVEIVYCLKGRVRLVTGFQRIKLNAGDFFSIDCQDIHCLYSDVPNIIMSVYIDLKKVSGDFDELKYIFFALESMNVLDYQKEAIREMDEILLALGLCHVRQDVMQKDLLQRIADGLIDLMLKKFNWFMNEADAKTDKLSAQIRERFKRITIYCQKNYDKKITLSTLAKEEFINENYVSQFMKGTNYKSFMSMINSIRCYNAENMLLTTDLPATEIASLCGFSDTKYFYNSFKEWWGCTPKEHREWYREYFLNEFEYEILRGTELIEFMQELAAKRLTDRFFEKYDE